MAYVIIPTRRCLRVLLGLPLQKPTTTDKAMKICHDAGLFPAEIHSDFDRDIIKDMMPETGNNRNIVAGASMDTKGSWNWASGHHFSHSYRAPRELENSYSLICLRLRRNGEMQEILCATGIMIICERKEVRGILFP